MRYFIHFLITAGLIWAIATYAGSIGISLGGENTYVSALVFSVVLAIVNLILGTILRLITLPLRIITLGLFSFIITAIIVKVADELVSVVTLTGILPIVVIALVMSVSAFIFRFF